MTHGCQSEIRYDSWNHPPGVHDHSRYPTSSMTPPPPPIICLIDIEDRISFPLLSLLRSENPFIRFCPRHATSLGRRGEGEGGETAKPKYPNCSFTLTERKLDAIRRDRTVRSEIPAREAARFRFRCVRIERSRERRRWARMERRSRETPSLLARRHRYPISETARWRAAINDRAILPI